MSERTLKQLVGALVVAIGLWAVTSFLSGGGGAIEASGEVVEFFEGLDAAGIESIRLDGPNGPVELVHSGEAWTANGYDTDLEAVGRLVASLSLTSVGDLVATNPSNHDRMGVSTDSAVSFEVDVNGRTRSLLVGNQGPRFGTVYGRLPGADEVYVIEGDLRMHVRRGLDEWRDKGVIAIDTAQAYRIEVRRDGDVYGLVRGDSLWTFADGGEVDAGAMLDLLGELASNVASGFVSETDSLFALPEGAGTVAYSTDGSVLADVTLGTGEGERWARVSGDSIVYRMSSFRAARLAPTLEQMTPGG